MKRQAVKTIPEKTKAILLGLAAAFIVIFLKVGSLALVQHDEMLKESQKPQKRKIIEKSQRASICDRFGELLATNKIQYNAGICYGQIKGIPRTATKKDVDGKKTKLFPRKEYISQLCQLMGSHLEMDPERIEDLLYSKAAILGNAPFILKENISEEVYFKLKILEKDWPGIITETAARRIYPLGKVAAEAVGYIGPISKEKYRLILEEMKALKEALSEDPHQDALLQRLVELERLSYSINDLTGKVGVEATCDERLRGKSGKRVFLTDIKGNLLQETAESEPAVSGKSLYLTLSADLQKYAESLLAEYSQQGASAKELARREMMPEHRPWIKEGAIVVMEPASGEILALASYPRYDPNDFSSLSTSEDEKMGRQWKAGRWLESLDYLGAVWDGKTPLVKEAFDIRTGHFYDEEFYLDWAFYLSLILPKKSPVMDVFYHQGTLQDALSIQDAFGKLQNIFKPLAPHKILDLIFHESPHRQTGLLITLRDKELFEARRSEHAEEVELAIGYLQPFFYQVNANTDKLLVIDLYRLSVDKDRFSPDLALSCGRKTLQEYKRLNSEFSIVESALKIIAKGIFKENQFKIWREQNFKEFLAEIRREEKLSKKKFSRPYVEYLDQQETIQFESFWAENRWKLINIFFDVPIAVSGLDVYKASLLTWRKEVLDGAHHGRNWTGPYLSLSYFLDHLPKDQINEFLKTLRSFEQLKEPLYGHYPQLRSEEGSGQRWLAHLALGFYPRYGYGHLRSHAFRQAATIGSMFKLVPAYAALVQEYETNRGGPLNPLTIVDDKHKIGGKQGGWNVGFFNDGRPIPLYYHGGRLPKTDHSGVGKIDVAKALEVSSNPYFALLAGDVLEDPEDLSNAAALFGFGEKTGVDLTGEYAGLIPQDITYNRTGLYSMAIGQHTLLTTPLQAAVMLSSLVNGGKVLKPKILLEEPIVCKWQVFLPEEVKYPLLDGMKRVVVGDKGTARMISSQFPSALVSQTIGKTSTAEVVENYGCDSISKYLKTKAIWFGAIVFSPEDEGKMEEAELVIIVYLRQGEYGRLAVPYAMKMAQKWREIKKSKGAN